MRDVNFGIVGVAGFVAPRHLKAIKETGHTLIAATDPHDSVGVLDGYFPAARYFPEIERFDRHLEKLRRRSEAERMHVLSVCSPNYLHDAHVRLALRLGADAICEKPLVINPWNLDQLAEVEAESGRRVWTVLQLRYHPVALRLRERPAGAGRLDVVLTYVTPRGPWYQSSWKGDPARSGGLAMNLGIHFFDLLQWLFGPAHESEVHLLTADRVAGLLELERARVRWFLSSSHADVPAGARARRAIEVDGETHELSDGFGDLHTRVYAEVGAGRGLGIQEARPSIELGYRVRTSTPSGPPADRARCHPALWEGVRP